MHKATRAKHSTVTNLLLRAGARPGALNCWGEEARTLAPAYRMNPSDEGGRDGDNDDKGDDVDGHRGPGSTEERCVACSGKRGRHYYFCKSDVLQSVPDALILGSDGKPIARD